MILGIDEVGRGPWAGPLVVGAVVLGGETIEGLTDSKKLTKKRRNELDVIIRERASGYGLGWVHADEIDELGLSESLRLATRRAVEQVKTPYHEIIIDGTINFLAETTKGQYVTTLAKADLLVPSVSAASIIAKVARDNFMSEQDEVYAGYSFGSHVGYGTAAHIKAIDELGVTPLHRLSFAPLAKYRREDILRDDKLSATCDDMASETTISVGNRAEGIVAEHLAGESHTILERNWKTKYCEIDIISRKDNVTYFTEVKYRKKLDQGGGLAAITPTKLKKMTFAARVYVQAKKLHDEDIRLAVASVGDDPPTLEQWFVIET